MTGLPQQCKLISQRGRLGAYTYTFECVKNGSRRRWTIAARTDSDAHGQMRTIMDDPLDMGDPAPNPPTGGGGGCLLPDELVLLESGDMKPVRDIAPGDRLMMCRFGESTPFAVEPDEIVFHYTDEIVTVQNGDFELTCSSSQPVITPYGPVRAGYLFPDAVVSGMNPSGSVDAGTFTQVNRTASLRQGETLVASVGTKEDLYFFATKALVGVACHIPPDVKR